MKYVRMPIEVESPEQLGYNTIKCNLTESSFRDSVLNQLNVSLNDLVLCYGDHLGQPKLRELIANDAFTQKKLNANEVLITVGAAAALFIISTTLLEADDELIVVRPNYATNIETPRAIGAKIKFIDLKFEDGFQFNPNELKKLITPKTKLVSITIPHNPTGTLMSKSDLAEIIKIVEGSNAYLLVDETYREMNFEGVYPVSATLSKRVISVSSLSKTFGLPGIRIGWLITQDQTLMEKFLAAKEQIFITGSILDETVAIQFLEHKNKIFPSVKKTIQEHFGIVKNWISNQPKMEWVEPKGGVVCFPRLKSGIDENRFYKLLNDQYKTHVGPGHWFEMDRKYMRIGYGWPTTEELKEGLDNINKVISSIT